MGIKILLNPPPPTLRNEGMSFHAQDLWSYNIFGEKKKKLILVRIPESSGVCTKYNTYLAMGNSPDDKLMIFFLVFLENMIWHLEEWRQYAWNV